VLAIHHTGKVRNQRTAAERGSSALRCAADVMVRVYQTSGVIHVKVEKQKDEELSDAICLRLKAVTVGTDDTGKGVASCILISADGDNSDIQPALGSGPLATLQTLVGFPEQTAESGAWQRAIPPGVDGSAIPAKTFQNHRQRLVEQDLVEPVDGREHCYQATDQGTATANGVPLERQRLSASAAATATPPKGVADGAREAQTAGIQFDLETQSSSGISDEIRREVDGSDAER
jgi:hypothetical protein